MISQMIPIQIAAFTSLLSLAVFSVATSMAAEIKLLSAGALESSLKNLIPQFERTSGHKVVLVTGTAGSMAARIEKGEVADVGIVTSAQIETLMKQGKIATNTRVDVAKVAVGIATRKGAVKPDITTVEALKRALVAAKSIGHFDPAIGSASGAYAARWLAGLDIAAELKPKVRLFNSPATYFDAISTGEAELGFGQMTEIMAVLSKNIDLVGPLPVEVQNYTRFSAAILANSKEPDAGSALIRYLSAPASAAVMKEKGLDAY